LNSYSRIAFVWSLFLVLTACSGWAQMGVPLNHTDPKLEEVQVRELVAQYCRMDYSGGRLSPAAWGKVQPLVAWPTNPDYSLFMVTSRFDVDNDLGYDHGKYVALVHYRLLGKYDLAEGYSQDARNQIENVRFVVSEVNGEWRITEIDPAYPHPSKMASAQWVSQKLAQATDAMHKMIYQQALEKLQAPKAQPPAE